MKAEFWMLISARKSVYDGWKLASSPKCTISKPDAPKNAFAVKVTMDIPDAIFDKPSLEVGIQIPDPSSKLKLTPSMIDGIQHAIAAQVGVNVHISCDNPPEAK